MSSLNTELADVSKLSEELRDGTANPAQVLERLSTLVEQGTTPTMVPYLPIFLNLEGKPYTLDGHFPMEPLFRCKNIPQKLMLLCGRQVSKSTTLAAQSILRSAVTPYFNTLCVTPLFEQVRRFSNNVVRPFIEDSPIKPLLIGSSPKDNNVFQRTFANGSNMYFSYAGLDAERIRGISASMMDIDEVQDLDFEHIPLIAACMSASKWELSQFSGTPKTTDNTAHVLWEDTSQAHWTMKCVCGHWNMASLETGLDDMVQEAGFCCPKCSRPLDVRSGFYYHLYKDRIHTFPGYHIPQPVLPMHCYDERKWFDLYHNKKNKWPRYRYLNEVLGVACDVGSRLVTRTQLISRSILPWGNKFQEALTASQSRDYSMIIMGVDWGGGAGGEIKKRKGQMVVSGGTTSFTVATVVGFRHGSIYPEVLYMERMPIDMTPPQEAERILRLFYAFRCRFFAHDFTGAGSLRETIMVQSGMPHDMIVPCTYVRASNKSIMTYNEPTDERNRRYYSVDKARSLALLCACINSNMLSFPRWADHSSELCLQEDFLSLIEDYVDVAAGSNIYRITKNPRQPDDACHAINFACLAYWHYCKEYPAVAQHINVNTGTDSGLGWNET